MRAGTRARVTAATGGCAPLHSASVDFAAKSLGPNNKADAVPIEC